MPVVTARELIRSTRHGARAGMSTQLAVQAMSICGTVVLARLLAPRDFGVIALTSSIAGLLSLFASIGVGANLVRRKAGVERAATTYYWALLAASVVLVGVLEAVAPVAVSLAGQPESDRALRVLALCLPPALLVTVVQSVLRWRLSWSRYNLTVWLPALSLVVVEVVLAVAGWGYWAVVAGLLFSSWFGLVLAHVVARWRPTRAFSFSHIREDLGMTGSLWAQQFLTFVQRNADYWAVSAFLGASSLGFYYVAFVLPSVVRQRVTAVSHATLLPVLSRCADDPPTFRRIWSGAATVQMFVGAPALMGLAAVGAPVVGVFFGDRWDTAVAVVPWICLAALVELYMVGTGMAAVALGLARRSLVVAVLRTGVVVTAVFVAAWTTGRLEVVAQAVAGGMLVGAAVQDGVIASHIGLGWRAIRKELLQIGACTVAMYACVRTAVWLTDEWHAALTLLTCVPLGIAVYGAFALLLARETSRWVWRQARLTLAGSRELRSSGLPAAEVAVDE